MSSGASRIEWTDSTWSPVRGCTRVSPGCDHCYAIGQARRQDRAGAAYEGLTTVRRNKLDWSGVLRTVPESLDVPRRWRSPRMVFVNSMSDLFHRSIPEDFVRRVFEVMLECERHTFQILTKRPEHAVRLAPKLPWPDNVWLGVSVENEAYSGRIGELRRVPARVRFLSLEPLLGPLDRLSLHSIDWVIVGGESGPGARPVDPRWVRRIRDRCVRSDVPFFFKQWGGVRKKEAGRVLDGRTWDEYPTRAA